MDELVIAKSEYSKKAILIVYIIITVLFLGSLSFVNWSINLFSNSMMTYAKMETSARNDYKNSTGAESTELSGKIAHYSNMQMEYIRLQESMEKIRVFIVIVFLVIYFVVTLIIKRNKVLVTDQAVIINSKTIPIDTISLADNNKNSVSVFCVNGKNTAHFIENAETICKKINERITIKKTT